MTEITRLAIVDSTLREGEQFALAHFTSAQRMEIASLLDEFGVDFIEMTSPSASPQSEADLRALCALRPRARVLTHTRCDLDDVNRALDAGVDGVNVFLATSERLRHNGHGRSIDALVEDACEIVEIVRGSGRQVRFSCEDAFRTEPADLLRVYRAVDACAPDRLGIADTVGIATPSDVARVVGAVRAEVLSGYRLELLPRLDETVAAAVGVPVPFNAPITGAGAFTHKAGVHTKAVLTDPASYEFADPERLGRTRTILAGHRLVGRNAIRHRALALGIDLDDERLRALTAEIKRRADLAPLPDHELDALLRAGTN